MKQYYFIFNLSIFALANHSRKFILKIIMLKKGTKIYSVLRGKCPSCHKGDFFKHSFTMNLFKVNKIKKTCSYCDLKYMIEPAFYFGALYVSYGITVALCIVTFVISKLMLNVALLTSFITIFVVLILFIPKNLRLSRVLWINMFVSYRS